MAFLDKNGLQTLTNKLVQGDAIKVASHRGHTVKNVIDNITSECENITTPNTMTLENRVSEFKVGKGRDVDVSGDVEEGKIEVELQGKTYQNCFIEKAPWFSTETTLETSSTVAVGLSNRNQNHYDIKLIKSNTTYTIIPIVDFKDNYLADFYVQLNLGYEPVNSMFRIYSYDFNKPTVITTKTIVNPNAHSLFIGGSSKGDGVGSVKISSLKLLILEGDYSQTLIEELPLHFEGIQSSFEDGIVDVEVQGKNLFNGQLNQWSGHASVVADNLYQVGGDRAWKGGKFLIDKPLEVGKKYTISFDIENVQGNNVNFIFYEIKPYKVFSANIKHFTFTFTCEECEKPSFIICSHNGEGMINVSNIQITKTPHELPYEPYYKKKISFNIGEPLRSLPNGVCDEIRNNNGQWELVRKIGKVVLDGSEGWYNSTAEDGASKYFTANDVINDIKRTITLNNQINSHFVIGNPYQYPSESCMWALWQNSSRIRISIKNISDLSEIKNWLSQNPTTIYYELETPIITPIEPIEFDVKPLATTTINSEIAPVSNHKVVLNRAGQIEQGIVQIAELKKRVDSLETAYDSNLLETQWKLSNLSWEYDMEVLNE